MVEIDKQDPRRADVVQLLAASDALMAELYPSESNHMLDVSTLAQLGVSFFTASENGAVLGCGAWVRTGSSEAELKRMFVDPRARGQRIGLAILDHIERDAFASGVRLIRLETGIHQPEALNLYRSQGYIDCEPFPPYSEDPLSVFMEKRLG